MSKKNYFLEIAVALFCFQGCPQGGSTANEEPLPNIETQNDAGVIFAANTDTDAGTPSVSVRDAGQTLVTDAGELILDSGVGEEVLCDGCVRSALFPADWTPEFTSNDGYFLHDFSYAGYHQSERALPDEHSLTIFNILDYGADATGNTDSTFAIQAAIDAAENNEEGLVFFPEGEYECSGNLNITHSNIVLRGAGTYQTFVNFSKVNGYGEASIRFQGTLSLGEEILLNSNGLNRSRHLQVEAVPFTDAGPLEPILEVGDDVVVGFTITSSFVQEHGMSAHWAAHNNFPSIDLWRPFFRRNLSAVDLVSGNITLDVPLRYPAKIRDGASVRKISGHLSEVGIENMSVSNAVNADDAWGQSRVHLIEMTGVKNGWVRDIKSFQGSSAPFGFHLQSGGIIIKQSKNVTIADSTFKFAQNRGGGGNGYLFEVMQSNEILFRDCTGKAGRHNFVQNWDFGTSGVVFLRTHSSEGKSLNSQTLQVGLTGYSEFHHALAIANLIDDSFASDGWAAVNRRDYSSGAGVTATQSVFWNLKGDPNISGIDNNALLSFQSGDGYVIGTKNINVQTAIPAIDITGRSSLTGPEDYSELIDEGDRLYPSSLFEAQLNRRLGFID